MIILPLPIGHFCHFQNGLIFRIFIVFWGRFLHRTTVTGLHEESFLALFFQFKYSTQYDHFAKSIAFVYWPFLSFFKMASFFEYSLFCGPFYRATVLGLKSPF